MSSALPEALTRLSARDLVLRHPTRVILHPSVEAFSLATRRDEPGLMAWAHFDVVHLAPLAMWADAGHEAVAARLAHELCHLAIHQAFGAREDAERARVPRVFEEGICSLTAQQGPQRMTLNDALAGRAALDEPELFAAAAFVHDPRRAYALAHHAAALIETRHDSAIFARILDDAARDRTSGCVERALVRHTGLTLYDVWRLLIESAGMSSHGL